MSSPNVYLKDGDQITIAVLTGFYNMGGQQVATTEFLTTATCETNTDTTCLATSISYTNFFVVKLQGTNNQKTSFKYSYTDDDIIRLGDLIGLVQINPLNTDGQLYGSVNEGGIPDSLDVIIHSSSWAVGSDNDLHQVWLISDASDMGYYNSGCDGTTSPTCSTNPTCGLQPPTNIPVLYGQSYVIQNYGQMVDQTVGGNNYSQWFIDTAINQQQTTNINRISDTDSKPSENAGFGYFVTFLTCNGTTSQSSSCVNYFDYYHINPIPLPEDADPIDTYGLPWWVYTLIGIGFIVLIIIAVIIYIFFG